MNFTKLINKLLGSGNESQSEPVCCSVFINGNDELFNAAFNTLNSLNTGRIKDFAARCRILTTGSIQEIRNRFYHLRHANYGYCLGTEYTKPDFGLLKKYGGNDFPAVLAAGMMHQSGYCREDCTVLISDYPEYICLTLYGFNDWVPQVRSASEKSFFNMLPKADLINVIRAYSEIDRIIRSNRFSKKQFDKARSQLAERISRESRTDVISAIKTVIQSNDRCNLYFPLLRDRLISPETAESIIKTEEAAIADRLAPLVIDKYDLPVEHLIEMTESRFPRTRYVAARRLYEKSGLWQNSDRLLLDKSNSVIKLLCRNTGSLWNAMPYFIRLYYAPEEYICFPVRMAISKRSYIYLSTREHAEEIRRAIEENPLPENLTAEIYREIGVI